MNCKYLALSAALLIAISAGRAQIVDSGSETGIAAKTSVADAKPAEPASSPEEERSRTLLQLKAERRAAAGKHVAGDAQLAEIDGRISALQQQIAGSYPGLFADTPDNPLAAMPVYPRIVQPVAEYQTETTQRPQSSSRQSDAGQTSAARGGSFAAPADNMSAVGTDTDANLVARKALDQSVTVVSDAKAVSAVLDSLASQTHANVWVNWVALQTAGIDRNTPVTLSLNSVTGTRALRAVLDEIGANTRLGYTIDDGVVTVSTREDLSSAKYQTVRVFDVRDLIAIDPQYPLQVAAMLQEQRASNLMDTLKSTVAPDTWRDNGGTVGSIRELDGLLIINQTADNQAAVEQMLAKIRTALGT